MIAGLLLQVVQSYAAQTAARGAAVLTVDALNMVLMSVLVFLILRQVMPIASGLAGGLALNSYGLVSRAVTTGLRQAGRIAGPAVGFSAPHVMQMLGTVMRDTEKSVRAAAATSGRYVYHKAGVGIDALSYGWRKNRR
jgi:hypothetical protein